jgi:hypothetical protein
MAELNIRSLTCVKKEDQGQGRDEVHLLIDTVPVFGPEKMDNGDEIAVPLGNQPIPAGDVVRVELFEVGGGNPVQLGAVIIPDFLPGNVDYFGVFDDELPGAFYFMKYQIVP